MDSTEVEKTEQAPIGEPVSPPAETPAEPSPEQKMAEFVKQQIAATLATEITKAVEQGRELGRRDLQRQQERNKAELARMERRAMMAETTQGAVRQTLQNLDPEAAKELELAELRAREQGRASFEQEDGVRQQQEAFHQQFFTNIAQLITTMGVNPEDKRIDWAPDAPNYLEAQRRILESASRIQKEGIYTTQTGLMRKLKQLEEAVKKTTDEANSVSTAASGGAASTPDAVFLREYGLGKLPSTKENVDRVTRIQKAYQD